MKMTRKLRIIIIPLLILPFTVILILAMLVCNTYVNSIYGGGFEISNINMMGNPIQMVNSMTVEDFSEIQKKAKDDPEALCDDVYLNQLNERVNSTNSFIAVKLDGAYIYKGSTKFNQDLQDAVPDTRVDVNDDPDSGIFISDPDCYFIKQQSFELSDGSKGEIYILSYLGQVVPEFKRVIIKVSIVIAMVILFINMFITVYMYSDFIRPIKLLKDGTEKIRDGNLSDDVEVVNDDEIGELCQSFNEMRKKLKESIDVRMKYEEENRELISNISHDLKTPITAIKGYVEGIMDGVADSPEKMDKYIKTIYNKTNEMDALINELSLYTKLDNNSIPYNFIKINVKNYFNDCMDDIKLEIENAGMRCSYQYGSGDDVCVVMDPEQIRRVVNNIVGNAIKYSDGKYGFINISISDNEDNVQVNIEDNGRGIKEEDLPFIFDRMYRADSSRNTSTGGSGLGLAIARRIVEEHGGTISAKSRLGIGTTITFTLKKYEVKNNEQDTNN